MATRFARTRGTHTAPRITAGSPSGPGIAIEAVIAFEAGSIRLSPVWLVIHTASSPAAVQVAPSSGIRATIRFVAGSILTTPSAPVAQTDPNAPTTPTAWGTGKRFTTRFPAGSIRTSVPSPWTVAHAEPNAKVAS